MEIRRKFKEEKKVFVSNHFLPKLTIGMPVLNGEKTLKRAIESLQKQTYGEFILLISDNGSDDESLMIIQQYEREDNRIKVLQKEPGNAESNFRNVLMAAETEFFMWASADDYWKPNFIENGLKEFSASTIDFFSPNWWVGDIDKNVSDATAIWSNRSKSHRLAKLFENSYSNERFLAFINLHHWSHKCNIVYSIFRTSFIKKCYEIQDISMDLVLGAVIVKEGSGRYSNEVTFYKDHDSGLNYTNANSLFYYPLTLLNVARHSWLTRNSENVSFVNLKKNLNELFIQISPENELPIQEIINQYKEIDFEPYRITNKY